MLHLRSLFNHDSAVIPSEQIKLPSEQRAGVFATTHWSMVIRAGDSRSPEAASAMERLCQTYWYPLYAFVRRKGTVTTMRAT